jgi:hypothetical protein
MGQRFTYCCSGCGYAVLVSGKVDVGETCRTVTISCATCRELSDVVVSTDPFKVPPDPVPDNPRCARARTRTHVTQPWTAPGPCPRCGTTMGDDVLTIEMWD